MTQHQILAAVVDGTLFVMVECDLRPGRTTRLLFRDAARVQERERHSR